MSGAEYDNKTEYEGIRQKYVPTIEKKGLVSIAETFDPSLLTKFRKQRLKDENILDLLINKSVELAINQGVLKSNAAYADIRRKSWHYQNGYTYANVETGWTGM